MTKGKLRIFATALGVVFLSGSNACASASSDTLQICEKAARLASQKTGVPLDVLRAISLTETGRRKDGHFRTWPWTVNMEGAGRWFDTKEDALSYALRHHQRGARSFDVGCFQINFRWHGGAFDSIEQMFDPETNALYAARFLSELHQEFGDWTLAAGAFHSRTPKYAKRYRERFAKFRDELEPLALVAVEPIAVEPQPARRDNTFPFLVRTPAQSSMASLVPLHERSGARLIEVDGRP